MKISLKKIFSPFDIKKLSIKILKKISFEMRTFLIESISKTGGHLSSNLGIIELTIAIHKICNAPYDRIIWDVGHQSYAHKILTGRISKMKYLRQNNGISGFPKIQESDYDSFGTAHSSTSISAILGMSISSSYSNYERFHVAIIGDGAMSAGISFEAINNLKLNNYINLLIIVNDNNMSISSPVGTLSKYISNITSLNIFNKKIKKFKKKIFNKIPRNLFEIFGLNYIGPVDGHNLDILIPIIDNIYKKKGLYILHIITKKGKGYTFAEKNPVLYHGVGKFDKNIGILSTNKSIKNTFSKIFGKWLCHMAEHDKNLIGITPAMKEGSNMKNFEKKFPNRYFDVGIAEQHAITLSAGFAYECKKPVLAIYSTFLQRGYDQLIHDVAIQKLDVTFAIDRAGIVGKDGSTHSGSYDISYLRCIPNIVITTPSNEYELIRLLYTCYKHVGPASIRYQKGFCLNILVNCNILQLSISKSKVLHLGKYIVILCFGFIAKFALKVGKLMKFTVIDMRFVKPLDKEMIKILLNKYQAIVTIEEGVILGGAGSAILELMNSLCIIKPVLQLGFPDKFLEQGESSYIMSKLGLDSYGIKKSLIKRFM